MYADQEYILDIRRRIHEYPEIGFDLPKTVALVKAELEKLGIEYTEGYGESSVVGIINPGKKDFTIGIRADMDALLIDEKTDLPFKSKIPGQMHACGHDAHTAMLLGTAKALKEREAELACRVMLVFQPSEEGLRSGAEALVQGGLMEEIDVIIGLHIENWLESGTVGVCKGSSMASSRNFRVDFYGKTAHATHPHSGTDALATAIRAYNNIQFMLAREINPFSKYVCSVGKLSGGTSQNIIADHAYMLGTIRTFDMELDSFIIRRIGEIATNAAAEIGAVAKLETDLKAFVVYNNPYISDLALASAAKVVGEDRIVQMPEKLSSEDFSQYLTKKPGVFIRLGTRNAAKGCTTLPHNNDFMIDEDAFEKGTDTCVQFVLDYMNGIDMKKVEDSDERRKQA